MSRPLTEEEERELYYEIERAAWEASVDGHITLEESIRQETVQKMRDFLSEGQ